MRSVSVFVVVAASLQGCSNNADTTTIPPTIVASVGIKTSPTPSITWKGTRPPVYESVERVEGDNQKGTSDTASVPANREEIKAPEGTKESDGGEAAKSESIPAVDIAQ